MAAASSKMGEEGALEGIGAESAEVDIHELRSKVTNAVRSAITDVVARTATASPLPDVDLDFSMPAGVQAAATLPVVPQQRAIGEIRPGALPVAEHWRRDVPAIRDVDSGGIRVTLSLPMVALALGAIVAVLGGTWWVLQPAAAPPVPQVSRAVSLADSSGQTAATTEALAAPVQPSLPVPAAQIQDAAPAVPEPDDVEASGGAAATAAAVPGLETATLGDVLRHSDELIGKGQLRQARKVLLGHAKASGESAGLALALAKVYDANVLAVHGRLDGTPDPKEAEHWYRRWYELAVRDGMAANPKRLERLIRSLR